MSAKSDYAGDVMRVLLSIVVICLSVSLLAWPFATYLSIFLFDNPGPEQMFALRFLAGSVLLYPIPIIFGTVRVIKCRSAGDTSGEFGGVAIAMFGPIAVAFGFFLAFG